MKKIVLLFWSSFFFFGCTNSYSISKKRLKCRHLMINGFSISKISVTAFGKNGIPVVYRTDTTVECVQNNCAGTMELEEKLNPQEYHLYNNATDTIEAVSSRNSVDTFLSGSKIKYLDIDKMNAPDFRNYCSAEKVKDSIIKLRFPFYPKRKIYFNRKNENYKWFLSAPALGETTYSCPLQFQKNCWYEISDLSGYGFFNTDCDFFIYVDAKGKMHRWHACDPWSPI